MNTKTLHLRLKSKNTKWLSRWSKDVNTVWNYCNDLTHKSWKQRRQWLTAYDIWEYTSGCTKAGLEIGIPTVQSITEEHATRRKQFKRSKLRWRSKKNLGWIPFKVRQLKFKNGFLKFNGKLFKVWDSYNLKDYQFRAGSFSQNSLGRWYVNITVQFEAEPGNGTSDIGIDLGLKDTATVSDGTVIENPQYYRALESDIAIQQRANNKNRVRRLHTKVKNQRKDYLHKVSRALVNRSKRIAVGNVSSSALAQSGFGKSVNDVGWAMLKTMLEYKSRWASVEFCVVNEAYSTQTCSVCGCISGPKGLKGLGIRYWKCSDCGVEHQRDVNAAKNILNTGFGHEPLVAEITGPLGQ